ncbi:hypothetical protein ACFSR7_28280 [Cohnella sp. GCM10020058]|uniref:hypothetical protein n=1 Tax=Cohnella sp. GCM10020058 TaxID=3317330 RepID=UPI003630672B
MDMNIGSLMRAFMKDSQPTDVKALELRVGQIVRGVLIEMLDGQDALMNINGVPVRAKLEAEMSVGQSTLLQVRPDSSSGLVSLRPLADVTQADAADLTLAREGVKAFGLPEQPWSRELLRGLARDGYPVTRETADWFAQAASAKPPGADAQEWMNAAGVAFRRGLQPTETTIGSLRQALYGQPLHEQLSALAELAGQAAADPSIKPETADASRRVLTLLRQVTALVEGQAAGDTAPQASGDSETAGGGRAATADATAGVRPQPDGRGEFAEPARTARQPEGRQDAMGRGNVMPQADPAGVPGDAPRVAEAPGRRASDSATAGLRATGAAPDGADEDSGAVGGRAEPGASSGSPRPANGAAVPGDRTAGMSADKEPSWIGKLLNALGANHEHAALKSGIWSELQAGTANAADQAANGAAQPADSLKSVLLGLTASDDVPPALREAAQNLVQQITGQQLLLSAERQNTAMMSHMTLFVPMKGQDGETTAKVHIEARRGRRGQLDADNCRLLFDLDMRHMGRTVVDVQVVDRMVSLRLLNDQPGMAELVEEAKGEAADGLSSAGYRLMSLTAAPYPERVASETGAPESNQAAPGGAYAAKLYKGIDYRA